MVYMKKNRNYDKFTENEKVLFRTLFGQDVSSSPSKIPQPSNDRATFKMGDSLSNEKQMDSMMPLKKKDNKLGSSMNKGSSASKMGAKKSNKLSEVPELITTTFVIDEDLLQIMHMQAHVIEDHERGTNKYSLWEMTDFLPLQF